MRKANRLNWPSEHNFEVDPQPQFDRSAVGLSGNEAAANDIDGWQQYRRWVSRAPAPKTGRSGPDASLYTWQGYRSWTDKVRRGLRDDKRNENQQK